MLTVLGASHHDLELTQLERLAAAPEVLTARLRALAAGGDPALTGVVVVATCNRLEIYLDAVRFHDAVDEVTGVVADSTDVGREDVRSMLKVRVGAPVAAHLFAVTAGLDAMVVGEVEIAGQVGRAFREAREAGVASPALHQLFESAARTAKQVASATGLGAAGRSIASVALDIAAVDGDLPLGARALVIGTGAYARVVAAELRGRGAAQLAVFSPSGRAEAFGARHAARPIGPGELTDELIAADLVISCSGHRPPVLTEIELKTAVARRDAPLPVIDLTLGSDVSAAARAVPGVRLIDLHTVAEQADPTHRDALAAAQDIVIEAVADFEERLARRRLDPAVVALRQHISAAVGKEMDRLRTKYPAEVAADIELALHRVTQTLLHTPTLRAKEVALTGDSAGYVQALHTLFGIDIAEARHDQQTPGRAGLPA